MSTNTARPGAAAARRAGRGFTLIEVMITVAILGILAAVAFPSYQENVRKGRRADGQAVLMEAAQFMERFHTQNFRYDRNVANVAVALPTPLTAAPKEGASKHYDISLQAVAAQSWTLRAVPRGAHQGDRCGTLTLDNLGRKGGASGDCWRR
jgi:type IV pilus assembly protein PilE